MFDYKRRIDELPKGSQILHEPLLNKGSAFSLKERDALNLNGLLPPIVLTIDEQKKRIMENFNNKVCVDRIVLYRSYTLRTMS